MRAMDPEDYEDLVASDHECHTGCIGGRHHDRLTPTVLALPSAGWRGSFGSAEQAARKLWRLAGAHVEETLGSSTDARGLIEHARLYRQLLAEWEDEQQARLVVWEAQQATQRAKERFDRRRKAAARRQQPRKDVRSPNKPTRVDVHPEAWTLVKQNAIKQARPVADVIGVLVVEAPLPAAGCGRPDEGEAVRPALRRRW